MYLSKRSRKMLKCASKTTSTVQQKYYSGTELAKQFHICDEGEAVLIVRNLKDNYLIEIPYETCPDLFFLTEPGKAYEEFRFHEFLEFFKCSVLCPIIVTVLSEAILHGVQILCQMILSLER